MANKIQLRRGVKANLPVLSAGEPAFTTDTKQLFIGDGTTNTEYAKKSDIPTSLKSPNALTVQFNGATNKTYDGSSAQTVNITPSGIGAYTTSEIDTKVSTINTSLKENTQEINLLKKSLFLSNTLHYYVSPTGSDSNDGSADKPFATIQHAIDQIPFICYHTVTISIANGTYSSFDFKGRVGGGYIEINGESADGVILDNFTLTGLTINTEVRNMTLKSNSQKHVIVSGCSRIKLKNLKSISATTQNEGFFVEYSNVYMNDCEISNKNTAIYSFIGSNILVQGCSGSNNTTALMALYGGAIAKDNNTITGTTQENAGIGGVIR